MMTDEMRVNLTRWNELALLHAGTRSYNVAGFKAGETRLHDIELAEMGDVRGKTLLHLQCHFGLDTLSWAREGAVVTGVDWSDTAITIARELAEETGIGAAFVQSNIYNLPDVLDGQFDIVFTSYGVLWWLPDLAAWGRIIARYLKPGGAFFIAEAHPFAMTFDDTAGHRFLQARYPYFNTGPLRFEENGSYADPDAKVVNREEYGWNHSLSEIFAALLDAGLRIERLNEYERVPWKMLPMMESADGRWWQLPADQPSMPLLFTLRATKPA